MRRFAPRLRVRLHDAPPPWRTRSPTPVSEFQGPQSSERNSPRQAPPLYNAAPLREPRKARERRVVTVPSETETADEWASAPAQLLSELLQPEARPPRDPVGDVPVPLRQK